MRSPHDWRALTLLGALLFLAPAARAQSEESELPPAPGEFEPAPLPPPQEPFLVPDVPDSLLARLRVRERWMTLKLGLVLIADYTAFDQDADSITQVGTQDDQWEARAARLMLRGTLGKEQAVGYLLAGEYKGFETDPEDTWQLTDLSFTFPLGGPATKLTVGKTKQTFDYEMVGDAGNLPHQERVLSPFFVSRDVGLKLTRVIGEAQRMTAAAGVFNNWFVDGDSLEESGTDVTTRITGLVRDEAEGKSFLHLGFSSRYVGAENGVLRYKGRPESNVTDNYVDTGDLPGDHAWHLSLEALWNEGPFSLLAEYDHAWVSAPSSGDPEFSGGYVTGSWVLTGETRPYDRTVGYARRVMPEGPWGAPELVARLSREDLDDGAVQGGSFDKTYLGINWWATRRWKLGLGWGHTLLDRFDATGTTDSLQLRLQWVY
ncbi:MAG: porin [Planctomycetota bacterium]